MTNAAVGFRVHSGWASVVALSLKNGLPEILARERVHLVEKFTYEFRQPYHTAEKLQPEKAAAFVSRMQSEARELSGRAIRKLQAQLEAQGRRLVRSNVLLASGRPLPALPQILASHSLIHTADGELFREALLHASARCELDVTSMRERQLLDSAARMLRLTSAEILRRAAELGRAVGPPWSQDEKFAAIAAWLALTSSS
ncbi:MAG TPA: hypothetical protein VMU43_00890 [Candidatus Acidoferrum sp.]|nr:hypothetical protein [Candidatus Acidoferrum sp.]